MKFILLSLTSSVLFVGLSSCVNHPVEVTYYENGNVKSITSLGTSVLALEKDTQRAIKTPELEMVHASAHTNTAVVPQAKITGDVTKHLATQFFGVEKIKASGEATSLVKGTKDPNIIPKDPNVIPVDPNVHP